MIVARLAFSNLTSLKVRTGLTLAAIAFSISLVVAVTSGYQSLETAVGNYISDNMGSADIRITRRGNSKQGLPAALLSTIRAMKGVERATGRFETSAAIENGPDPKEKHRADLIGVVLPEDVDARRLKLVPSPSGKIGEWFTGSTGNSVVIDQEAAKAFHADIGSTIRIPWVNGKLELKVVGIIRKPGIFAEYSQTMYVPLETLQRFAQVSGEVNRIFVTLKSGEDQQKFKSALLADKSAADLVSVHLARDVQVEVAQSLKSLNLASYVGGGVSMLAAACIIFSTLSMGVTERSRVLAMMRAVGAARRQLAAIVFIEAMLLALLGAAVGIPLGWVWVKILAWNFPTLYSAGAVLSRGGVLFGAGGAVLAAVVASLMPALAATRVSPLEALTPQRQVRPRWGTLICAAAGLLLIAVDPILLHIPSLPQGVVFYGHLWCGIPCLFAGFFLLSPGVIWLSDRLFSRPAAMILGANPGLLRQQLSTGMSQAAGAAAALMVGLASLVLLQTQGNTILGGWKLPDKFPDMFVGTGLSYGLTDEQVDSVARMPGVERGSVLKLSWVVAGIPEGPMSMFVQALNIDSTLFIAIDPDQALRMMELHFLDRKGLEPKREGEEAELVEDARYKMKSHEIALKGGGALRGIPTYVDGAVKLAWREGETQTLPAGVAAGADGRAQIAGVGTLSNLRLNDAAGNTWTAGAGSIDIPKAMVQEDTPRRCIIVTDEFRQQQGKTMGDKVNMLTSNHGKVDFEIAGVIWSPGIDVMVGLFDMSEMFEQRSGSSVFGSTDVGRHDFGITRTNMVAVNLDPNAGAKDAVERRIKDAAKDKGLRAGDVREIKRSIEAGFGTLLLMATFVAVSSLAVASLGVANTIIASIRTRRWQIGILRSIGVTRSQFMRLILAESILLGIAGVLLGLAAGFELAIDASDVTGRFFGYQPPLLVPWGIISAGVGAVIFVALLASLWPAAHLSRLQPLRLLQSGRAAS